MSGFGSRVEKLAKFYDARSSYIKFHCEQCKEERDFRNFVCMVCKWHKPAINKKGELAKYNGTRPKYNIEWQIKCGRTMAKTRRDKAEFLKRQAEESRKKWESK